MKLYFSKGACSLVVRIVMNELDLKCEYESVDLKSKKTASGENFLTVNPKGSVPVIEIEKGKVLTENAVILQYLGDTHTPNDLLPAMGELQRYRVLEWLNYITTELHKGFSPLFNPEIPQELKDKLFIPQLIKKFQFINTNLQSKSFLASDHFTLPDAYLFVMLRWAKSFKLDLSELSNLEKYFEELKQRKSIVKSLEQEGLN